MGGGRFKDNHGLHRQMVMTISKVGKLASAYRKTCKGKKIYGKRKEGVLLTGMRGILHNLKAKSAGRFLRKQVFVDNYDYCGS